MNISYKILSERLPLLEDESLTFRDLASWGLSGRENVSSDEESAPDTSPNRSATATPTNRSPSKTSSGQQTPVPGSPSTEAPATAFEVLCLDPLLEMEADSEDV